MQNQTPLELALRPGVIKNALIVAVIVGTILNLINQGDAILDGGPVVLWKLLLTYAVPYLVSTYGAVTALKQVASKD